MSEDVKEYNTMVDRYVAMHDTKLSDEWKGAYEMGGKGVIVPATKDTNPKDAVGTKKAPLSTVSGPVMMEIGVAMLEGARKYGRHNYRVSGVRASVYYDAAMRHLMAWYEGQDLDPDSGMSHVTKAMASLAVLRDAMINDKVVDDRPPKAPEGFVEALNKKAAEIIERYPNAKAAMIEGDQNV